MRVFVLILLMPVFTSAQKKLDNLIVIHDTSVTQAKIVRELVKSGFNIDQAANGYIKTEFKSSKKDASGIRLTFLFDGDSIISRAYWKLEINFGSITVNDPEIAEYRNNGSITANAFKELIKIVKLLTDKFYFTRTR